MKIRLMGTSEELAAARALLGEIFDVREASAPYPNRGDSQLYRTYIDVNVPLGGSSSSDVGEGSPR